MACPSCGAPVPPSARFCATCGHALAAATDERRVATVVIADLVGFTRWAERRDPEDVKRTLEDCFDRLAVVITEHGGVVDKIVGDALVALFGAPVAHGDDPERAVRAALRLHEELAAFTRERGLDLQLRAGVNTGEVLVGGIRSGDGYTAMGDTVNVASRLEQLAPAAGVLVGPATRDATAHVIAYAPAQRVTVRGRSAPLEAYLALGATAPPGRGSHGDDAPLVGREVELALLEAVLARTRQRRRAHLVKLRGEAGVGKRRLAGAFAEAAGASGALVLSGRVPPYGGGTLWSAAAELFATAAGADDELADRQGRRAFLARILGDDAAAAALEPGLAYVLEGTLSGDAEEERGEHAKAVEAVTAVLRSLAATRPVVVVIADVHWADAAMLRLLADVTAQLRREPIVGVVTTRSADDDTEPPLEGLDMLDLRLSPLDAGATRALALHLLGAGAAGATVEALARRSGGNPLLLEELCALAEAGEPPEALPLTLRGLMSARLDTLTEGERRLALAAAVIGYSGSLEQLASHPDSDALDGLIDADVLVVEATGWHFKTEALRDTAYLRLPKRERIARHRRVAAGLDDAAAAGEGSALRQRAQHLAAAADLAAETGNLTAADRADAVAALAAAARWTDPRDPEAAAELWDRALQLSADSAPTLLLGRARAGARLGRHDAAVADARRAGTLDPALRPQALLIEGEAAQASGRLRESAEVLTRAVHSAQPQTPHHAAALRSLGLTQMLRGCYEDAGAALTAGLEVSAAAGDEQGQAWAHQHLAWLAFLRGDVAATLEHVTAARASFDRVDDPRGEALLAGILAWTRFAAGDLEGACSLAEEGMAYSRADPVVGPGLLQTLLARANVWRGRTSDAVAHGRRAVELIERGHRWGAMHAHLALELALVLHGEPEHARAEQAAAARIAEELGTATALTTVRVDALASALLAGRAHAEDVAPEAGIEDAYTGEIWRLRALAALLEGDIVAAGQRIRQALDAPGAAGPTVASHAAAALIAAGSGDTTAALRHADAVLGAGAGTYLDAVYAHLARALTKAEAEADLDAAERVLARTEDQLTPAVVRLARAVLQGRDLETAQTLAWQAGVDPDGWLRVFARRSTLGVT